MDEVDIDGEDYNELEARLYGQIHHEAVDSTTGEEEKNTAETQDKPQVQRAETIERIVTEKSVVNRPARTNRVPDTRYWVKGIKTTKPANTFNQAERTTTTISSNIAQNNAINDIDNSSKNIILVAKESSNQSNASVANNESENQQDNIQQPEPQAIQKFDTDNIPKPTNLLIKPVALIKNSKPNLKKKNQKTIDAHVPRSGPFKQQENKLQKALSVQAKKNKSKNIRNKKRKQQPQVETILLDASSDNTTGTDDDVVLIPTKPPPTITVSDSDNEGNDAIQLEEDNAMDASDVVMDSKPVKSGFTKPTEVRSSVTQDGTGKGAEQVPSRCTSPCSVLSSDDFIGQTDRSRLLKDNGIADDEDLVLLTADVDSLMQPPQSQPAKNANQETNEDTDEVICTAQFTAPLSNSSTAVETEADNTLEKQNKQNNYHVDQTEFRAMDVYESESDIADSVYIKGASRVRTIIKAVDTSSDADDIQKTPLNPKVKRLSKRRTSSSNRGSDARNDDVSTDEELEDNEVSNTPVSFIKRGTAVERCNRNIRKRTQSLGSRRGSTGGVANATRNMLDTEFIATLNSLVQGREGDEKKELNEKIDEEDNCEDEWQSDSNEGTNVAQEQTDALEPDQVSLRSVQIIEPPPVPSFLSEAVPDDALEGLDQIFASIDNMGEPKTTKKLFVSDDSSEDEIEAIYSPVPSSTGEVERSEIKNTLPIGNIVYSNQNYQMGGVGWNEEMIRFYNFSWHGERFTVVGVQKSMDRDRKLWKIYTEDRFPKTRPYSNLKCFNCCEFGHTRAKCRRPKKPPICYMCGESGHFEPRCPNTICLRCGNKTQVFTKSCNACTFQNRLICPICKVRGHSINLCPDKWRRYHSTTQPNVDPNSHVEFNRRRMCCVCGASGHLSDTCRSAVRFMEYPVIVSHVKSHQKSYSDLFFKSPNLGIALNLLYRPRETVDFRMSKKAAHNGYYWRFLKAVDLGSVLRRKRPSDCLATPEKPPKHARSFSAQYKPNPYGKAGREGIQIIGEIDEQNIPEATPNQVQEVSGSLSVAEAVTTETQEDIDELGHMEYTNEISDAVENFTGQVDVIENGANSANEFKAPGEASAATTTHQIIQHKDSVTADSDSNYSFSDHFEIPPAAVDGENNEIITEEATDEAALDVQPSTSAAAREMMTAKEVREMEPLPDFIPLTNMSDVNTSEMIDNFDKKTGISRCFIAADTDDENEVPEAPQSHELPCEAKIYLTLFHSNFLLSPDGHEFLLHKSRECNIKARLDWTSVGHVLVIFGLPADQDTFHKALLEKYGELMNETNNRQLNSNKVPKRIDALIRFLRENISQLQSDLGDVNDLQRRIKQLEQTHTKANMKLAEKFRRLLNMILLGQAGLCDGDKYLNKLLINLRSLINDYQAENIVPQSLREDIDTQSKMIFTSYRHDNYHDLIQSYNRMPKNRQFSLNIDPLLLGQKVLNVSLTPDQRARLNQPPNPAESNSPNINKTKSFNKQKDSAQPARTPTKVHNEPSCLSKAINRIVNTTPAQSSVEVANIKDKCNTITPMKRRSVISPPFTNAQQRSSVTPKLKEAVEKGHSVLDNLLGDDISAGGTQLSGIKNAPSKGPSMFWSRESMRYLDECIQLAESNTELLSKLQRIQSKSFEGALSYNDYRAVIKLHGAMVGH